MKISSRFLLLFLYFYFIWYLLQTFKIYLVFLSFIYGEKKNFTYLLSNKTLLRFELASQTYYTWYLTDKLEHPIVAKWIFFNYICSNTKKNYCTFGEGWRWANRWAPKDLRLDGQKSIDLPFVCYMPGLVQRIYCGPKVGYNINWFGVGRWIEVFEILMWVRIPIKINYLRY